MRAAVVWLLLIAASGLAVAEASPTADKNQGTQVPAAAPKPAESIQATQEGPLAELIAEVLERNPELAKLRAAAAAADARAPQVRSLPDPMASVTAFLATPETRVGPQKASAAISQRLPWFGTLKLREQRALYLAAAAHADVNARRLDLLTETRRLWYELAFLNAEEAIIRSDRATLEHYEELARTRYASGIGLEQAVIKIQAEITRDDNRLLALAERRASMTASLNKLRDRPADVAVSGPSRLPTLTLTNLQSGDLRSLALEHRPEITGSRARISAAAMSIDLAGKAYRPNLNLGLGYTFVGPREDAAGRAMPPPGNGDDIVGVTLGFSLPVRREKLAAGVQEATASRSAAEESLRSTISEIERAIGDLNARVTLSRNQVELFDRLLVAQAQEALRSAEAAYSAGALGALDLLDAERTLLQVRIAADRTRTDYTLALVRLEGAVGAPIIDRAGRSEP
jgi:cobalt-zinc-cadmium efflux system outer membrane protein